MVTVRRLPGAAGTIPPEQRAIVGASTRVLRQRNGWTQPKPGELTGWHGSSAVCAAEGRPGDRQRGFTAGEAGQLAAVFGASPWQLATRCATCGGHPPAGFAWLACGATPGRDRPAATARTGPTGDGPAAVRG